MPFVLDASATLPWCFEKEATASTDRLLVQLRQGDTAFVPSHWPLEVMNTLLFAVRRGRVPRHIAETFLRDLADLQIRVTPVAGGSWLEIYDLAEKHRLTIYDAAYLHLARKNELPLATLDGDLGKAARAESIQLIHSP